MYIALTRQVLRLAQLLGFHQIHDSFDYSLVTMLYGWNLVFKQRVYLSLIYIEFKKTTSTSAHHNTLIIFRKLVSSTIADLINHHHDIYKQSPTAASCCWVCCFTCSITLTAACTGKPNSTNWILKEKHQSRPGVSLLSFTCSDWHKNFPRDCISAIMLLTWQVCLPQCN